MISSSIPYNTNLYLYHCLDMLRDNADVCTYFSEVIDRAASVLPILAFFTIFDGIAVSISLAYLMFLLLLLISVANPLANMLFMLFVVF